MKIIFFGSSDFAVPFLEALKKREEVILVVTQPDRKSGRALKVSPTPVKQVAANLGMKIFQPVDANKKDALSQLAESKADLFIVVSFGQILSKDILKIPRLYSINSHASLLPKYRGAAPINWAIANGEKETGTSVIKMDEKMDEGEIILQKKVGIDIKDDAVALSKKLSQVGTQAMLDSIDLIKKGTVNFTRQDSSIATYAPKLKKEDGLIDWNLSAEEIYNRIRGFVPWPGCFTYWDGKILKIWKAKAENKLVPGTVPGAVINIDRQVVVTTGKGVLCIQELQLENRRRMSTKEFIAGHSNILKSCLA